MSDEVTNLKVNADTYVNQATLELLQRRIESEVRNNFLKTVTLPIGGGGIVAIIVAVLFWIPEKVEALFKDPKMQAEVNERLEQQIVAYFKKEETKKDVEQKIRELSAGQIKDEVRVAVKEYFEKEDGQVFVREELKKAANAYFSEKQTQDAIKAIVDNHLKTDGKDLVVSTINEFLKPAVDKLGSRISQNQNRLVVEFEQQGLKEETKSTEELLDAYVSPENVAKIKAQGLPVVLTKSIRPGKQYGAAVIAGYLKQFDETFAEQFKYVAVTLARDGQPERLLALIPSREFAGKFKKEPQQVVDYLNNTNQLEGQARAKLALWFGESVVRQVSADQKVGQALSSNRAWAANARLDDEVAVVDAQGKLMATTTRRRLIEGLLN